MSLKAECARCRRSWDHDFDTTSCYWCGCKELHITDKVPVKEEEAYDWDEDTLPGWGKI